MLRIKPMACAISLALLSPSLLAATAQLRVVETTDIHTNLMDFNYYKGKTSEKLGLVRAATLVNQARGEVTNSVLVDNGDLLQGSPMGDYMAAKGISAGQTHPAYKAMNLLNYDVGNIGNHEFNYGLDFLAKSTAGANFPYISANIFHDDGTGKAGKPYFKQYLIKKTPIKDSEGKAHILKVGYIGFVPPQVMVWDKKNLTGKVVAKDIKQTALELVPKMKAEGADIVIAIPHSGLSSDPYKVMAENSVYYLSQVPGIDAIMFGHAHAVFPSKAFAKLENVDVKTGTINGVPAVMPGRWGSHIGIVDLTLNNDAGKWEITKGQSETRAIYSKADGSLAKPHDEIRKVLESDHKGTLEFVSQPIGKSSDNIYSFLALVQDDPSIQIVNDAQKAYVERFIQGDPDLDGIPVLSAAAPFKVGGRKNDPTNFTQVDKGTLTFSNAADLYLYPNTLVALKVTGKEVREWLECSAGQFNQIDTKTGERQFLINWDEFRTYNFDVIDGVNYQIDVTQPARYDGSCKLVNANSQRIKDLTFNGKPLDPNQTFIIATNNYRAYSAKFPGTGEQFIAFASPDENRQILSDYISKVSKDKGQVVPTADNNWVFSPIHSDQKLDLVFETSPSDTASNFIKDKANYPMTNMATDENGFALYRIALQAN